MVAPDCHLLDVGIVGARLLSQLAHRAVVVETDHGGEAFRIQIRRILLCDQGIGVGRVADDKHFHVSAGMIIDRLTLWAEDTAICRQQVLAFHALFAWHRADEQGKVAILERNIRVVSGDDIVQEREGAIVQFHDHALERAERRRDFQQVKVDRLVRSKHVSSGNAEQERITDLACSASYSDFHGLFHGRVLLA